MKLHFEADPITGDLDEPIKKGWYRLEIGEAEIKPYSGIEGVYICITFRIIGDLYNGLEVQEILHPVHPSSEKAKRFGRKRLNEICHVIGIKGFEDTEELQGRILYGLVATSTQRASYGRPCILLYQREVDPWEKERQREEYERDE